MDKPPAAQPKIDRRPHIQGRLLIDTDIGRRVEHTGHAVTGAIRTRYGFVYGFGNYGAVLIQFPGSGGPERCATNNLKWAD